MVQGIIDILNAKLQANGRIETRYCLAENRESGDGLSVPYTYGGNGEYRPINIGNPSLSWWKLTDRPSYDTTVGKYTVSRRTATYPMRLVAMFKRSESTQDDTFTPSWFADDVSNLLTFDNGDLKTALQAIRTKSRVTSVDVDSTRIWKEEFSIPVKDLDYRYALVAFDISVEVEANLDCWENECDYDPDILHIFDFCDDGTFNRLTQTQRDCLEARLCECAEVTIEVNGTQVDTAASGSTYNLVIEDTAGNPVGSSANPSVIDDSKVLINGTSLGAGGQILAEGTLDIDVVQSGSPVGSWNGSEWEVPVTPCDDATVTINGVTMTTIASGDTENIQVRQSSGATLVGSKQGQYWRIADSDISINGTFIDSVQAEDPLDIDVLQGGSPVGSWNGSEWVIPAATSPSISLAVSDATPSYGDTITFTATATGFSPASYTFIIPQWGGGFIEVTQAGNTYNWTVDAVGNRTASVIGVNGSTSAASSNVSLTIPCLPLDHISSNPDWACAFLPLSVRQTGDVVTVRRSSDNATSSYTATEYAGADPLTFVGAGTGYMPALIDQSENNRDVFQPTASYQGVIVESSARVVDSDGYAAWRNQNGTQAMRTRSSLCGTNGALFIVCEINGIHSGSQAWLFTNGGNPAVGTFSNNPLDASSPTSTSGTPSYYVNGVAIANTRGALGTALIGNRCVVAITGINFNQTQNWRATDSAVIGLFCNTSSKFLAFVAFNDFDNTERATFETELMTYYGI